MNEMTTETQAGAPPKMHKKNLLESFRYVPPSEHITVAGGTWDARTREYTVTDPNTEVTTVYRIQAKPKHESGRNFVSTEHYKNKKVVVQDAKTHEWREQRPIDKIRSAIDTMYTKGYVQKNIEPGKEETFTLHLEKMRNPFRARAKVNVGKAR